MNRFRVSKFRHTEARPPRREVYWALCLCKAKERTSDAWPTWAAIQT
ncbi:CORO7 isoform 19 [Pan troglodytes]|uniref:Coronin 7 n=2 Tax=Homininae TaxID=207598 RepID=I3L482_HUMAN|nr:CORO7 isoform 19 [Pan troglodytes]